MKQILAKEKIGVGSQVIAAGIVAIILYSTYRFGAFVVSALEITQYIQNFGFTTLAIITIMFIVNWLLRIEVRGVRKPIAIQHGFRTQKY